MSWGVYLHLPFCRSRCRYCAFYSGEPLTLLSHYVGQLETELRLRRESVPAGPAQSVYFGGGTPGLLAPHQVAELLNGIAQHWGLAADAEVTLEVNPGDPLSFDELAAAGVNRLSVGVQSFDDKVLHRLGRRHTAEEARATVRAAAAGGFTSVNADLLLGLDDTSPEQLRLWIRGLARDGVGHLSVYTLEVHPNTELARAVAAGTFRPAGGDQEAAQCRAVEEAAAEEGLSAYEVSNFSRPGQQCRHNLGYWEGAAYLGLGPGAHSYLPESGAWGSRFWNLPGLQGYLAALRAGRPPPSGCERLTREQALLERLFISLRRPEPLSTRRLANDLQLSRRECSEVFRALAEKGLFEERAPGVFVPTRDAMQRADGLALTIQDQLSREPETLAEP